MKQFREESRASIVNLESRMDKLSQTNDDLRDHLSTTRKELEQRERYIDPLNQELVNMSSASREHVHQPGTTQAEHETSMASTTQPDDTAPASQSAPAQVNLPASQSAPAQINLPVYMFRCPTTDSAMQLLSQTRIDTPDNIIIHTGENVSGAVRRVAERAQAMFPTTNIVVSTLLPRKDFPGKLIEKNKSTDHCGLCLTAQHQNGSPPHSDM
ncbi:unnamed protein product, partial [Coregonus sp. 'balchen']